MTNKNLYTLFGFLFALLVSTNVQCQIKINEVQSVNGNTIQDEDGDYEDWIEIVNLSTTTDTNLQGFGLSDDPSKPFQWKFPSHILRKKTGADYDRVLVFASGKDRYTQVHHWEMLINRSDSWKYLINTTTTSAASIWYAFMNNGWQSGAGGIGYGDGDDATPAPAGTISVFMQKQFTIADTSKIGAMVFSIDYDDAFVAYINGIEIARKNILGTPPAWNATAINDYEASMYNAGGKPESYFFSKTQWKAYLHNGTNILSIQVHNKSATSSDLSAIPFLFISNKEASISSYTPPPSWFPYRPNYFHTNFKIENLGETILLSKPSSIGSASLVDQVVLGNMQYNSSYARRNAQPNTGGDGTGLFRTVYPATPNQTNNTSLAYNGYTETPVISLASGFYNSQQTVTITKNSSLTSIRYTLNGNVPKITDKLYTGPITIDSTRVLKARVFSDNGLYFVGGIASATYFINCPTVLPIVSLTIDSLDLYDYNTGIYVEGPNAASSYPHKNANFWQDWEKAAHIEFYDTNRVKQFSTDGLIGIFGNYTRAKPQKSFDFKVQALYDSAEVDYKLFPERSKTKFKNFVLRNAGSDWMDAHIRDEYMHRVTYNTGIYSTSARTVVCYLNGKYWGVYHIREKGDEKFLSDLSDINKDSIDQIRTSGSDYAANGNMTEFDNMINYFTNANLTTTTNYNVAKSKWNVDNFMTYFAVEIYSGNDDWISSWINNIKLWKPRGITDAKWNYQLHDVDQGTISDKLYVNTLDTAINPSASNNHSMMLRKFLDNPDFKRQFINKFYDLFNTCMHKDSMHKVLYDFYTKFESEIPRACSKFPTDPGMNNTFKTNDTAKFYSGIREIKDFINKRQDNIKGYILNKFGITNPNLAKITIGVAQPTLGKVKLNSLPPTNQYWSGTYLAGNPIEAVAIAEPGYIFDYWEQSLSFSADSNMTFIRNVVTGDTLIAHFKIAPNIAITELNYKSDPTRNSGEWIELFNYSPVAMNISGWKVKKISNSQSYTIPTGTIINPNSYLVLVNDTNIFNSQFPFVFNKIGSTGMVFNEEGDEIHLTDNKDNVMIRFSYSDTATWPDCAKGYGRTLQIINSNSNPGIGTNWTCGCMGGSPGSAYIQPCAEKVIFHEINYNSADNTPIGDWVELYNNSGSEVDLSNWVFKDGLDDHAFIFPANTKISAWSYLVLVQDLAQFNFRFGAYAFIKKLGQFNWGLNGDKEVLRLYNSAGKIYQSMYYKDKAPWPLKANGLGWTLELVDVNANPTSPYSWMDGCQFGSPGIEYLPLCNLTVTEIGKDINIKVYPNPATDYITVETSDLNGIDAYFQLYDLQGRLIISRKIQENDNQNIALNTLQKGMYIFRIVNSQTTIGAGKLMKE
jgi:hypothetical protein